MSFILNKSKDLLKEVETLEKPLIEVLHSQTVKIVFVN